jgi:hypothetical protein
VNTPTRAYYVLLAASALALFVAYRLKYSRRAAPSSRSARTGWPRRVGHRHDAHDHSRLLPERALRGLAGSLHAHLVRYIDPTSFGLQKLIDLLVILIVAGGGAWSG